MRHLPILIVAAPLLGSAVAALAGLVSARLVRAVTLATLAASAALAAWALRLATTDGPLRYTFGGWPAPWGIEYLLDPLAGGIAVLVLVFALLACVYAGPYVADLRPRTSGVFHAVYLLLAAGLAGMAVTADVFNLYVFLEISSLSAYALVALGGDRSLVASFRYLLIGTVAGSLYLLGVGYLYGLTGTLNMADLAARLPALGESPGVTVAVVLMVVGLAIKMGLFPLHGWLPDVYSHAPAPVTAFIAGVMTKVSAYVLIRLLLFVLPPGGIAADALTVLGWVATIAIVAGSVMALAQTDVRRMLAYSSVGQMGYIVLGVAIGSPIALAGALLHMLNHAVMKACLFLVAGGVYFETGARDVDGYAGVARRLPLTMGAFVLAAGSMVGLPPTGGFFSKYYLLLGALEAGRWAGVAALVASSLLGAVYLFRVIERAYLGGPAAPGHEAPAYGTPARDPMSRGSGTPAPGGPAAPGHKAPAYGTRALYGPAARRPELPLSLLVPILMLAAAVLLLGIFNQASVTHVIELALPGRSVGLQP
jgi:multicomponent Na+:H+ antiporter subunit D